MKNLGKITFIITILFISLLCISSISAVEEDSSLTVEEDSLIFESDALTVDYAGESVGSVEDSSTGGDIKLVNDSYADGSVESRVDSYSDESNVNSLDDVSYKQESLINDKQKTDYGSSFDYLQYLIDICSGEYRLYGDSYSFNAVADSGLKNGVHIYKNITLIGDGCTLSGSGMARIFNIDAGCTLTLENINLADGYSDDYGGAILGNCILNGCTVSNNNAAVAGGAIYGNATITNCRFIGNDAPNGGAVYGNATITRSSFNNNRGYYGAAVYGVSLKNCTFADNIARESGGAVFNSSVLNCSFTGNAAKIGGAVSNCSSVINSSFLKNSAPNGGAVYNVDSISNCVFDGNNAMYSGGAIYEVLSVENSNFTKNIAIGANGGAVYNVASISGCVFDENKAIDGGAVFVNGSNMTVSSCQFSNNLANKSSAISVFNNSRSVLMRVSIENSIFSFNKGIYVIGFTSGINSLSNSNFTDDGENKTSEILNGRENYVDYSSLALSGNIFNLSANKEIPFVYNDDPASLTSMNVVVSVESNGSIVENSTTYHNNFDNVSIQVKVFDDNNNTIHDDTLLIDFGGGLIVPEISDLGILYYNDTLNKTGDFFVTVTGGHNKNVKTALLKVYNSFTALNKRIINEYNASSPFQLHEDYEYVDELDSNLKSGIPINKVVKIQANGHTIDAKHMARIFNITDTLSSMIVFENGNLINGFADKGAVVYCNNPGILFTAGHLEFNNVKLINNTASEGGIIYGENIIAIIYSTLFENNTADKGAIFSGPRYASIVIDNSRLINNGNGSSLFYCRGMETNESESSSMGLVALNNSVFYNNTVSQAILISEMSSQKVENAIFCDNIAESISYIKNGTGEILGVNITNNRLSDVIILNYGGNLTVENSNFNEPYLSCEYIANQGELKLNNNTISRNELKVVLKDDYKVNSLLKAVIFDNETKDILTDNIHLTAKITDDNGNLIYGEGFFFLINGNESIPAIFNYDSLLYEADYIVPEAGTYFVAVANEKCSNIEAKGIFRYIKGSFTDLIYKINDSYGILSLDYDINYIPSIDASYNQTGIPNVEMIYINETIAIDGNGHSINGTNVPAIFFVNGSRFALSNVSLLNSQIAIAALNSSDISLDNVYIKDIGRFSVINLDSIMELDNVTIINSSVIINNGTISSPVMGTVLDNQTLNINPSSIGLTANVTDGNGNQIYDNNVYFNITDLNSGEESQVYAEYDSVRNYYNATFNFNTTGIYRVSLINDRFRNFSVSTAIVKVLNNTFKDLQKLINESGTNVQLDMDYVYNPVLDAGMTGILIDRDSVYVYGNNHVIDGQGLASSFDIKGNNTHLIDLTIANFNNAIDGSGSSGSSSGSGSSLSSSGIVSVENNADIHLCRFINNTAIDSVLFVKEGTELSMRNTLFENNSASSIIANNANLTVIDNVIIENNASSILFNNVSSSLYLGDSIFHDNNASNLIFSYSDARIFYSRFYNNTLDGYVLRMVGVGELELFRNEINTTKGEIYINGYVNVISPVYVDILKNETVTVLDATYHITAKVVDDEGNIIVDPRFAFSIGDKSADIAYNPDTGLYEREYLMPGPGIYLVDVKNNYYNDLTIKTGVLYTERGSLTDLERKINASNGTLTLDYNYTYSEDIDGNYSNGIQITNKTLNIIGNGYEIDAKGNNYVFYVENSSLSLENIVLFGAPTAVYNKNGSQLTINDSRFSSTSYSIVNEGELKLSNNTFESIYNNGIISSYVNVTVGNNDTSLKHLMGYSSFNATVFDDNGNRIIDDGFLFEFTNLKTGQKDIVVPYSHDPYMAMYKPNATGTYLVSMKNERYECNVSTSIVKFYLNLKDLKELISKYDNNSIINLENDYEYCGKIGDMVLDDIADGILIDKNITINGNGHYISGSNQSRLFNVTGGSLALENILIGDSNCSDCGGIYVEDGNLELRNLSYINSNRNDSYGFGGAITLSSGANLYAFDSQFVNCSSYMGGAIMLLEGSSAIIDNCSFINNSAYFGSAIGSGGNLSINDTSFISNKADNDATVYDIGSLNISNSKFIENTAESTSAIYVYSKGNITNCEFISNHAQSEGTVSNNGDLTIDGCLFANNTADKGGAVYLCDYSKSNITNSKFLDNKANESFNIFVGDKEVELNLQSNLFTAIASLESENVIYGDNTNISGSFDCGINGKILNLTLDLNGEKYIVPAEDGKYNLTIANLPLGNYTVALMNYTDSNSNNFTVDGVEDKFKVLRSNDFTFNLSSDKESYTYGETIQINASLYDCDGSPASDEQFMIIIDDVEYGNITTGEDGIAHIDIDALDAGDHIIKVILNDSFFGESVKSLNIPVDIRSDASIDIGVSNIEYGDIAKIDISGNNSDGGLLDGNISLLLNGVEFANYTIEDGKCLIELENLNDGEYNLTVIFSSPNYRSVESNASFNVSKTTPVIDMNASFNKVDEPVTVDIILNDKFGNPMNASVLLEVEWANGTAQTVKIENGKGSITLNPKDYEIIPGNYTLNAVFAESDNYNPVNKSIVISLEQSEALKIIVDVNGSKFGEDVPIKVTITDKDGIPFSNATVNITVNGNKTTVKLDENGSYIDTLSGLPAGNNSISIYVEDGIHKASDKTVNVEIAPSDNAKADVEISPLNPTVEDTPIVNVNVTDNGKAVGGKIGLYLDGEHMADYDLDENGSAAIPIENINAGSHLIELALVNENYTDDVLFAESINVSKVSDLTININLTKDTYVYGENITAMVEVTREGKAIDGVVEIGIDGEMHNLTLVNGKANFTFTDLTAGDYTIIAKYPGSDIYQECNDSANFSIKRKATMFNFNNMTTKAINTVIDGRLGEYFRFQLLDEDGNPIPNKPVSIGFNGKIYPRTTDANGWSKLQINLKLASKYTFAFCFLGDDNYTGAFGVALITVQVQTPKLTAASKTYKASAKTKKISATFLTSKGNAIAGKKITFTVNGKTYSAKTNSKGVATVSVSLSKKGTYSFTAKYAGDSTYKAISKSAKLYLK